MPFFFHKRDKRLSDDLTSIFLAVVSYLPQPLSDKTSRLHPLQIVPKPAQAYEPEVPVRIHYEQ
jgi:hypothetical protein